MRIRLGLKTHKGTLGAENEDRFLIGMDPASNDWLYSPEEISVGEFGTLILLADGLRENGHGSKAANLVCQTIKKLFDEMLEIPPDQDGLISLLRKFFIIANQQLILKTQENQDIRGFGCSASMVLIKDDIAYVVWVGNCRVYRYSKKGVAGSFFCSADRLEQLNVDHQVGVEKQLLPKKTWSDDISEDELTIHFGMEHRQFLPGVAVVQMHEGEKIMICTEGLFGSLDDQELEEALSQNATPDVHSEDLITKAFNANATESISVIIAEMLNGPISSPIQRKVQSALKIEAISLLGHQVAEEIPSTEKNQDQSSGIEPGTKDFQSDITPMKVRTVLPDGIDQGDTEQFFAPSPKKEQKPEEILPPKEKTSKISAIENALKKEQLLRKLTPGSKKEGAKNERQPDRDDLPVSKSKPRIMATAYPDPDDHSDPPRADTKEPSDDIEEKTEPKIAEESETPELTSDDPSTLQSDIYEEDPVLESMEEEEVEEEFDGEEEPGDPFIADDPGEDEVDMFAGDEEDEGEEPKEEAIDDEEVAEFLPDPKERELSTEEEVDQEIGSPEKELESEEDIVVEEIEDDEEDEYDEDNELEEDEEFEEAVDDEEVEGEVVPTGSDDPAEDLVIPSIYADEMVAPLDSFQPDEDEEVQEEPEEQEPEEPKFQQQDRSFKEPTSTQKSIPSNSATIGHDTEPSDEKSDTPIGQDPKPSKGGLGIRIGVILVAILLLGMFICNQMGSENMEDLGLDRVDDRARNEASNNQENSNAISDEDTPEEETTADIEQEAIVDKPEVKPVEEKKEEKPKEVVKEKEPERLIKEPDYDDRIKENKQQLTGEVEALLKQKNALCRQINTYQKNAPSKKQDKIKELAYDCDQLDKKFVSIYDSRSGFFKTVRYDLLSSTINNIKFSIEQVEKKFEAVRSEQ